MAVQRSSLRAFLATARGSLRAAIDSSQKITFVIGNESADLDSMTCSVLYAYLRSMSPPRNAFASVYVPITNIPASGIQMRPEFVELFKHANIESRHLITLDDLPELSMIQSKLPPENTNWILVDHNALQGQLGKIYSGRVGGVIDHHDDEGKVPAETGDEPRVVDRSGSCTSLVTEYCRQAWDLLSSSGTPSGAANAQGDSSSDDSAIVAAWDAEAALLGLASILIDTSKLQSEDKTTSHDTKAVEYLEAKIMACPEVSGTYDRNRFYEAMDTAKKDIGRLQLQEILTKDYKQWDEKDEKLGISSVVKAVAFLRQKAKSESIGDDDIDGAFLGALQEFAKERELDLYSLMTTSTSSDGEFRRELLVWGFSEAGVTAAQEFANDCREELGLEEWSGEGGYNGQGDGFWRHVWWQTKVQHSRKRVAPLLRKAMT
ncbi:DHH phosphoesterase [Massarina eburnea CBS 473.64]|uniref:DHH phosphoesterase n=1 Tax=Massarina eburnea CBS 473.64 TaxID=1395130 RepID=A0A6A6SKE1_9PLEO|nr:DHH phosphoesterase [Massarina eburnea CBS 473.64]